VIAGNEAASIKTFVRDTLGCKCPDSVFSEIARGLLEIPTDAGPLAVERILVGARLLIYLLHTDDSALTAASLPDLLALGRRERDAAGYHRFRLVLSGEIGAHARRDLDAVFERERQGDDNVHLHIVSSLP
jgi:hypothetical protein